MAQKDGADWLLHVDTDELIYPAGSPAFSLQVQRHHLLRQDGWAAAAASIAAVASTDSLLG